MNQEINLSSHPASNIWLRVFRLCILPSLLISFVTGCVLEPLPPPEPEPVVMGGPGPYYVAPGYMAYPEYPPYYYGYGGPAVAFGYYGGGGEWHGGGRGHWR